MSDDLELVKRLRVDLLPGEEWRHVCGYEGLYAVSNMGRVYSIGGRARTRSMLKKQFIRSGYLSVILGHPSRPRPQKSKLVHRLVLEAFIGPCPNGKEVAHNNGDRSDNRAINLRWATKTENAKDRELHGNHPRVVAMRRSRLSTDDVRVIREQYKHTKQADLAAMFGVSRATIQRIHRGDRHV